MPQTELPPLAPLQPTTVAPPPAPTAVVTPAQGPPSQEPPKPIILQNAAVGLGTTIATNVMTSGLTGDTDIVKLAALLNGFAQGVKTQPWFNERRWMIWFLIAVGIAVACWYYRDPEHWDLLHFWMPGYLEIPGKGILNGGAAAFQSLSNYHGLAATGASPLQPTPFPLSAEAKGVTA